MGQCARAVLGNARNSRPARPLTPPSFPLGSAVPRGGGRGGLTGNPRLHVRAWSCLALGSYVAPESRLTPLSLWVLSGRGSSVTPPCTGCPGSHHGTVVLTCPDPSCSCLVCKSSHTVSRPRARAAGRATEPPQASVASSGKGRGRRCGSLPGLSLLIASGWPAPYFRD